MATSAFSTLVERYAALGWSMIDLAYGSKRPTKTEWPDKGIKDFEAARRIFGAGRRNIGIVLGERSGGLVDVDVDCDEALQLVDLLPATSAVFGRASTPRAHFLFNVLGKAPTVKFTDPFLKEDSMIIEIRGDGGVQTVFPPSMHPDGERIEWNEFGDIPVVRHDELVAAAGKIAARVMIERYGEEGHNHPTVLKWLGADPRDQANFSESKSEEAGSDHGDAQGARQRAGKSAGDRSFFRTVNDFALANLGAWVGNIFPEARYQPGTGAYRISSKSLGRSYQEDLSIAPTGIVDFGVHDMGDARAGKRTPIDIVMDYGGAPNAAEAALWLCERMGVDPVSIGWSERHDTDLPIGPPNPAEREEWLRRIHERAEAARDAHQQSKAGAEKERRQEDQSSGNFSADRNAPRGADDSKRESLPPLKCVPFCNDFGIIPPPRRWFIKNWVPAEGEVTGLYGDGGIGKSFLVQLTQALAALSMPWFGIDCEPVRSLGFYCEDSENELWRRKYRILQHLVTDRIPREYAMAALSKAQTCSRLGMDNLLMTYSKTGKGEVTQFQKQIKERAQDEKAKLVILDNAATMFPGNSLDANQVRQFVDIACGGIASAIGGSVILCAHPSQSGMFTGRGDSGSVQWNAAFRSRLYLHYLKIDNVEDKTTLILSRKKGNYANAHSDDEIRLKWTKSGILTLDAPDDFTHRPPAKEVFLSLLDQRVAQQRFVSDKSRGSTYAPKMFASMKPHNHGYNKVIFAQAMEELFASGAIEVAAVWNGERKRREVILRPGTCLEIRCYDDHGPAEDDTSPDDEDLPEGASNDAPPLGDNPTDGE